MNLQFFQVLFCHKKYKYHFLINCKPLDFQGFKAILNFQIFAVICTFSFGSAFAQSEYVGTTPVNKLADTTDFYGYNGANTQGTLGITEAYRDDVTDTIEDILAGVTSNVHVSDTNLNDTNVDVAILSSNYYAGEKEVAKAAAEKALADVKAATTDKAAYVILDDLEDTLAKLTKTYVDAKYAEGISYLSEAYVTYGKNLATSNYYFLEGYGYFYAKDIDSKYQAAVATATDNGDYDTNKGAYEAGCYPFVQQWLFDNGYNTKAEVKTGLTVLASKLVPVTDAFKAALWVEWNAIENEFTAYKSSNDNFLGSSAAYGVGDMDTMEALLAKADDFLAKYALQKNENTGDATWSNAAVGTTHTTGDNFHEWDFTTGAFRTVLLNTVAAYATKDYAAVKALADYKKLTDADKANVIALYDYVDNCGYAYEYIADFLGEDITVVNLGWAAVGTNSYYANLGSAYEAFLAADQAAFKNLKGFKVHSQNGTTSAAPVEFDATAANVDAIAAQRAAYDEFVKNYGYSTEIGVTGKVNKVVEAELLAAEYNQKAAAGFDAKEEKVDTAKVQAYLNNATVTVKSTKLAAKKVRVQAKVNGTDFAALMAVLSQNDLTLSYKFYHKAPGKSFKLTKTKGVNYITYTSKSLKAGKNSFRVGLVVKDADGKVVAEKSYQASSLAYRTIK